MNGYGNGVYTENLDGLKKLYTYVTARQQRDKPRWFHSRKQLQNVQMYLLRTNFIYNFEWTTQKQL